MRRKSVFFSIGLVVAAMGAFSTQIRAEDKEEVTKVPAALKFEMKTLDGKNVPLKKYQDKVILIVNVASECGLTPQYEQLQALHKKYSKKGLAIVAFPCNQFGRQEPGSPAEIREFCSKNYGIEFDMFGKIDVNGDGACDLYKYLTKLDTKPAGPGKITWNFEKFLVDRNGDVIARFAPRTKPDDKEVIKMIERELAAKKS